MRKTAFKLDYHLNDPIKRFVFVEGYAHVGDWDRAIKYSCESYRVSKNYVGTILCTYGNALREMCLLRRKRLNL
ncbi:MAG TPA: hypothetical protein VLA72_15365 [Anaerolineales bacterium]|nr:hypothetical protein [Anaerolineales bacterium]